MVKVIWDGRHNELVNETFAIMFHRPRHSVVKMIKFKLL